MQFDTWRQMISVIATMDEDALRSAINYEVSTFKRKRMISRMHQRYSVLYAKRERQELLAGETLL